MNHTANRRFHFFKNAMPRLLDVWAPPTYTVIAAIIVSNSGNEAFSHRIVKIVENTLRAP